MALSFTLQSLIDTGSFGYVYQAQYKSPLLQYKSIAVKTILKTTKNEEKIEREIKHWQLLDNGNKNILHFEGVEEDENHVYMICEYCHRGSLHDILRDKNKNVFLEDEVRYFTRSILNGIHHCHQNHIAHCDMKPANILLSNSDDWKICDFGNSLKNTRESVGLTRKSGTPLFLSPEMFYGQSYGNNIDMWALGLIVYMLFYRGKHPFDADVKKKIIYFSDKVKWMDDYNFLSLEGKDFISKCLRLDKTARLSSFEAMNHPFVN
jgi:serine/threonine protein kinase